MPSPERPRAVVTGCAGFIGSWLCEALVADGWRVGGVDAFRDTVPRREREGNLAALAREPRFDLAEADLLDADLPALVAGADVVVHLAGRPGVRGSFGEDFAEYLRDNVAATGRVLDAARTGGVGRVVWASSSSVYGDVGRGAAREDDPLDPRSPYALTKCAGEDLAAAARRRGLDVVGLRYFTVYGPRQRPDMAVRRMCEALAGGPRFTLLGDGRQARDVTHVDDVVEATLRAMSAPAASATYNVAGGAPVSVAGLIAALEEAAGAPLPLDAAAAAAGDVGRTAADTSRARSELGWRPAVRLADGLAGQLAWVRERAGRAVAA